ncbi:MAG: hypothetical protein IT336_17385 [Thermomicrobiales bacterium]|nr:hypothetical protein [Thermomicrobiales bacterium]
MTLVSQMQRDVSKTLTLATEAPHLAREIGDEWGQGIALRMLGDVALARRGVKVAAFCYLGSLSLSRDNGSLWTITDCLAAIGSLAM